MKPLNLANALFVAAALGLWACQHPAGLDKTARVGITALAR
jgi:hypothetical protein